MSKVRILVGTSKGAFILNSDGKRQDFEIDGPLFGGWEIYHIKGSLVNPDRLYVSQSTGWHGQIVQTSDSGGKEWGTVNNEFLYDGHPGSHLWYDGTKHPWEFARVWHFEPSLTDEDTVYAGVEDAGLFISENAGKSWKELSGFRTQRSGQYFQPGAGGMCLHTILLDEQNQNSIVVAVSAAGVFRSDDKGETFKPINKGLISQFMQDPEAEVGHCVHKIAKNPLKPNVLYMQKHWDVMKSDNGGDSWYEISGNLPTDFGFPICVNSNDPETIYVIPITSDREHFPPNGKLRVWRSKVGGNEWEELYKGLPELSYANVLRDCMATDNLESCGIYFGTTTGELFVSRDSGDTWSSIISGLPRILAVEVQTFI